MRNVQLSRRVADFNRRINNPVQRQWAWLVPPWAIIVHHGRRSGRTYRTPVDAFRRGDTIAVAILYGEESDWVRNVLAGDAQVVRRGRTYALRAARVVGPDAPELSPTAARIGRLSGALLVAELDGPLPGFGRGPRAG